MRARFDTANLPRPVVESVFDQPLFSVERRSLDFVLSALRPDDVFLDVGAMWGLYTAFAGKALEDGSVHAFEPYPPNVDVLDRTVAANDLANVTVHEVALADATGHHRFESPSLAFHRRHLARSQPREGVSPQPRGQGTQPRTGPDEGERDGGESGSPSDQPVTTFAARTLPGDSLVESGAIPVPDVVKIDVEGAEPLVVAGLAETLAHEDCRRLVCEIHPPQDPTGDNSLGTDRAAGSIVDFGSTVAEFVADVEALGFETELHHGDTYAHLHGLK